MSERRRMVSHHIDADGMESVSLNFRKWTGVLGFLGAVIGTSVTIAGLVLSMLQPVVTRWIHEETRPAQLEMSTSLLDLRRDLDEVKRTAATRDELDLRMSRMEGRLDDIYRLLAGGRR